MDTNPANSLFNWTHLHVALSDIGLIGPPGSLLVTFVLVIVTVGWALHGALTLRRTNAIPIR